MQTDLILQSAATFAQHARTYMNARSPFLALSAQHGKIPDGFKKMPFEFGGEIVVPAEQLQHAVFPAAMLSSAGDTQLATLANFFNYACIRGVGVFPGLEECDKDDKDGFAIAAHPKTRADYHIDGASDRGDVWLHPGHRVFYKLPLPVYVTPFTCETITPQPGDEFPVFGYSLLAEVYARL